MFVLEIICIKYHICFYKSVLTKCACATKLSSSLGTIEQAKQYGLYFIELKTKEKCIYIKEIKKMDFIF